MCSLQASPSDLQSGASSGHGAASISLDTNFGELFLALQQNDKHGRDIVYYSEMLLVEANNLNCDFGNFDVKQEPRFDRPVTDKVDTILEKEQDRRISSYDIPKELEIDHKTALIHLEKEKSSTETTPLTEVEATHCEIDVEVSSKAVFVPNVKTTDCYQGELGERSDYEGTFAAIEEAGRCTYCAGSAGERDFGTNEWRAAAGKLCKCEQSEYNASR
ncbi:hypothetical protein EVAR_65664_1, partial [Eumeta japonica]